MPRINKSLWIFVLGALAYFGAQWALVMTQPWMTLIAHALGK